MYKRQSVPTLAAAPAKKKGSLWKVLLAVAVIAFVIAAVNQAKPANSGKPSAEYTVDYAEDYVKIKLNGKSISDQVVDDTQNLLKEHSCTRIQISGGTVDAAAMEQISKLTDVKEIDFYRCTKVSGFDRLSGMPNLSCIHLTGSSESELDLTGIESIGNLESLYISRFESVDLMELRNAVQLKSLGVNYSDNITNLNGLAGLTNLTQLDLISDRISDLRPLSALTNLKVLNLSWNSITSLTELEGLTSLTNLTELDLHNNQVSDLQPLSGLSNLEYLYAFDNQITNLAGLENLKTLYVAGNQISDLRPLSKLANLESLSISRNQITTLSGLENLTNLTYIYASGNPLTDTSALEVSGCMDALTTD